ncbi:pyrophosphatase [Maribacter phage Panino]
MSYELRPIEETYAIEINQLRDRCYKASFDAGWHTDINTGELKERNKGEMLCLIHSEISEAMEGERKDLMDDHLPHRPMAEVELADALIRIMDYAGRWGYDIGGAVVEKMNYNANREDHKLENRTKDGGKKF